MFLGREHAIHFICEQIAAFLTYTDKIADLVELFLGHEHEGLSPSSYYKNCPVFFYKSSSAQRPHWYTTVKRRLNATEDDGRIAAVAELRPAALNDLDDVYHYITTLQAPNAVRARISKNC